MNKNIPVYNFYRHKYGEELLVDVVDMAYIKSGISRHPVHRETFYCIIFVTGGNENVSVNGRVREVGAGDIICSIPGEVWEWEPDTTIEGYVLIFEEQFLLSFFNDLHFLRRFNYLHPERLTSFLRPDCNNWERLLQLVRSMKSDLDTNIVKDSHILRAGLYGILILLDRAENLVENTMRIADGNSNRYIDRFSKLVVEYCHRHHDVEYYADCLCISPNYLNKIVNAYFATTAKLYTQTHICEEAKKLLKYTFLTVNEISYELNFNSPSYFIRFFKRHTRITPNQFREKEK